ncbi:MAG: hypothetical protein SCK29_12565 [Bacillota bacterium]|nr:hypothetical protein [Bacillota bacterium]MDW7684934.1 hypothetical protein [Bacillota bacterium]
MKGKKIFITLVALLVVFHFLLVHTADDALAQWAASKVEADVIERYFDYQVFPRDGSAALSGLPQALSLFMPYEYLYFKLFDQPLFSVPVEFMYELKLYEQSVHMSGSYVVLPDGSVDVLYEEEN